MFQILKDGFGKIFEKIKNRGVLTEAQLDKTMEDIYDVLLDADVAVSTAKDFILKVKEAAKGRAIINSISPSQMIIKIVHDEILALLSHDSIESELNLQGAPPVSVLLAGLQGSGKTTTSGKLALRLKKQNKKVLLVSVDTYRPAAQEQLAIVAKAINVDSLPLIVHETPLEITARAVVEAKRGGYDVVIYDTAGRLHIDESMITEIMSIKQLVKPREVLLVIDSAMGQDAVNVANAFHQKVDISGFILSRVDGDSRGGAALSIKGATGRPIKFLGVGEGLEDLEVFDAKRLAARILDMGDIVGFVEKISESIQQQEMEEAVRKFKKGSFELCDYIQQIRMIQKIGGFSSAMSMIPGMGKLLNKVNSSQLDMNVFKYQEAIFNSMTKKERTRLDLLNASRRQRIALGSGTSVQQVNALVKRFMEISKVMKTMSKMDPKSLLNGGFKRFFS